MRIRKLIYLDAFVPTDGQSLADLVGPAGAEAACAPAPRRAMAGACRRIRRRRYVSRRHEVDSGAAHPAAAEDLRDAGSPEERRHAHPRAYIYAQRKTPADTFKQFADRAKKEKWDYREIDASHSPHVTPQALATLFSRSRGLSAPGSRLARSSFARRLRSAGEIEVAARQALAVHQQLDGCAGRSSERAS